MWKDYWLLIIICISLKAHQCIHVDLIHCIKSELFTACKLDWNSKTGNLRNGWKQSKWIQRVIRVLVVCGRGYTRCTKKVWCLHQKGLRDKRLFSHTGFVHPHVSSAKGKGFIIYHSSNIKPKWTELQEKHFINANGSKNVWIGAFCSSSSLYLDIRSFTAKTTLNLKFIFRSKSQVSLQSDPSPSTRVSRMHMVVFTMLTSI